MINSNNKLFSEKTLKRPKMRKKPPNVRIKNFNEVALGLTEKQAISEARRCLQCKDPQCVKGCPVEINIPSFIECIKNREFAESIKIIRERDNIPAITGRVCPQETQCEAVCILKKAGDPIAIGALERFVEVIGEAAGRLSEGTRKNAPEVPWHEVIAMRNRLVHGYFAVDFDILWTVVDDDLPKLISQLESLIGDDSDL